MHYKAEKSILRNNEVVSCIHTFLGIEEYDDEDIFKFIRTIESEIIKGNTFDKEFFIETQTYIQEMLEYCFSADELKEVEKYETYLNKLNDLDYQNDKILNTDTRELNLVEFAKDGISHVILTRIYANNLELPSKAFANKERTGIVLQIARMSKEFQTVETTNQMDNNTLSLDSVKTKDASIGLWFHSIESIDIMISMLEDSKKRIKIDMKKDIRYKMYKLEQEEEVIQRYLDLSLDLQELER